MNTKNKICDAFDHAVPGLLAHLESGVLVEFVTYAEACRRGLGRGACEICAADTRDLHSSAACENMRKCFGGFWLAVPQAHITVNEIAKLLQHIHDRAVAGTLAVAVKLLQNLELILGDKTLDAYGALQRLCCDLSRDLVKDTAKPAVIDLGASTVASLTQLSQILNQAFVSLWQWCHDNPTQHKSQWPGWAVNGGIIPNDSNWCPACALYKKIRGAASGIGDKYCACGLGACPVRWPRDSFKSESCGCLTSIYRDWSDHRGNSRAAEKLADLAMQISQLPWNIWGWNTDGTPRQGPVPDTRATSC